MNKESFSLQSTLEANFLNVILPENPEIDEIAEKVIREDRPDFLIAYRDVNINGNITLKYKLINTIALAYSDRNMTKDQFIVLYMSLLNPFIQGKDWFLDYHNFCIDERYIFLDKQTMKASYIYVPEASFQNRDEDIVQFFKKIFSQIKIVNDPAFQVTMYQYFISDHVNFTDLYQLLQKEMKADMKTAEIRMPKVPEKPEIKNTGTKNRTGKKTEPRLRELHGLMTQPVPLVKAPPLTPGLHRMSSLQQLHRLHQPPRLPRRSILSIRSVLPMATSTTTSL